ncbi:MAG: hypothetical protein ABIH66_08090 [bacterium]
MNDADHAIAKEAERICNEMVMERPEESRRALEWIHEEQVAREVMFDGRSVPTLLRPNFISPGQERLLRRVTGVVMDCLEKVIETYFESDTLRDALHDVIRLSGLEREMVSIEPGIERCIVKSRLDAFMDGDNLKFLEFNCDSPAAVAYGHMQNEIFYQTFLVEALTEKYELTWYNRSRMMFDALIQAYKEFGGREESPHIAITDWRDVKTIHEFRILKGDFEELGCPVTIIDPRDFELKGDRLLAGGEPVDIVYRRVIIREVLEKAGEVGDFLEACRRRLVGVANSFRAKVVSNKSTLAVLTDRRFDHLFTDEQNEIKYRHIPWTRNFLPGKTDYKDKEVDVFELARGDKDSFILKPCDGYGGQGVCVGRSASAEEWEEMFNKAAEGGYVIQEYVDIPEEDFPIIDDVVDDEIRIEKRKVNLNPFAIGGHYGGCISRVSVSPIINVSAGGGMIPTFCIWPKEEG